MKFYTNKISTSGGNFSELIKTALNKEQKVKTASAGAKLNKSAQEAGIDDDGEGKREGKHWVEGSPSDNNGEPEGDGEVMTVEPAGLDSGKETMSKAEGETKLASEEGDSGPAKGDGPGDGEDLEGKNEGRFPEPDRESSDCYTQEAEDEGKADTKSSSSKKQTKKAGELPEALKEHQFKSKDSKDDEGNDDADDKEDDADKESCSMASKKSNLEKIANLTPKAKARLKSYWNMVYPEAYADAMTQDK